MAITKEKIKKWTNKGKVGSTWLLLLLLSVLVLSHGCSMEEKAFEKAKAENTVDAYRTYMNKHPRGKYEEEARYRIAELSGDKNSYFWYLSGFPKGKYADDATWWMAKHSNSRQDYEKYLERFPDGKHAKEARSTVEKMEYKKVSHKGTFQAYEDFITSFPNGELRKDAESRLESMLNQRHPMLKDAKTIKFILEESLPGDATLQPEFENVVKILADLAGIKVLDSEAENADVELHIQIKGGAKAAQYYGQGKRYTGAWLKGVIVLKFQETVLHERSFSGSVEPYRSRLFFGNTKPGGKLPEDAPFGSVFRDKFLPVFIDLMVDYFGRHILHAIAKGYLFDKRHLLFNIGQLEFNSAAARVIFGLWKSGDKWAEELMLDNLRARPYVAPNVDSVARNFDKEYKKWKLWIADLKKRIESEKKTKQEHR
jgi:hypothetical protein